MSEPDADESTLRNLIAVRDELLLILSDQFPPPEPAAAKLWAAYNAIDSAVNDLKRAAGFEEPSGDVGWTSDPANLP